MTDTSQSSAIVEVVRARYGEAARAAMSGGGATCCSSGAGASCCGSSTIASLIVPDYQPGDTDGLPEAAVLASLGCGNPTALAQLKPGQTVLDLGSGGGIDVLLSARRVGPEGFVYGLDMTDEMLELAERNRQEAGIENVRFLKGTIESIPLPDNSVDVIISNCVINLSTDKPTVFREAFRVLRPGGQLAVSDVVIQGVLDPAVRADMDAWAGCVAGALEEHEYLASLADAGFADASIQVTAIYGEAGGNVGCCGTSKIGSGKIVSGFIRATKPV